MNPAGGLPAMNQCWFVFWVVEVKKEDGLSMDAAEARRAQELQGPADICLSYDFLIGNYVEF